MANALTGVAGCGRCAAAVDGDGGRCPRCGTVLDAPAAGSAVAASDSPMLGVVRARGLRRRLPVVLDLLVAAAAAFAVADATGLVAGPLGSGPGIAAAAAVLAAAAMLGGSLLALRATGRSVGRVVSRLRTVDALSGLPPRDPRTALAALLAGGGAAVPADLARGRDPLDPRVAPIGPLSDGGELAAPTARRGASAPTPVDAIGARLVFDVGDELVVSGPVLLGRAPVAARGVRAVHALPDLSRGIGRTHLLADWASGLLWVTDLGTAGGTTVVSDLGVIQPLVADVRTAIAPGWQVRLGARTATVRSMTVEEGARRG